MWITKALLVAGASGGLVLSPLSNWTADLMPVAGHKVSGTATFNGETKDVTKVTVTLDNVEPNATLRWHLHKGGCSAAAAPILQSESIYLPLQADGSGHVNTTLSLPFNLESANYSVRVHEKVDPAKAEPKSDKDKDEDTVSCGDLKPAPTVKASR